jgi:hypothetical protein
MRSLGLRFEDWVDVREDAGFSVTNSSYCIE